MHVAWQAALLMVAGILLVVLGHWRPRLRKLGYLPLALGLIGATVGIVASRPPATLSYAGMNYGQEPGTPDPRNRACQTITELRTAYQNWHEPMKGDPVPLGRVGGWIGPRYFAVDTRGRGNVLVEVRPGCFLSYPPWI